MSVCARQACFTRTKIAGGAVGDLDRAIPILLSIKPNPWYMHATWALKTVGVHIFRFYMQTMQREISPKTRDSRFLPVIRIPDRVDVAGVATGDVAAKAGTEARMDVQRTRAVLYTRAFNRVRLTPYNPTAAVPRPGQRAKLAMCSRRTFTRLSLDRPSCNC